MRMKRLYTISMQPFRILVMSKTRKCYICKMKPRVEKKIIISKDLLWKAIIQELFEDFMAYFYPKTVEQIDFSKGYEFLDKELAKIDPVSDEKNRRADILVRVFLKTGERCWLLIHIEVQGYPDKQFPKRMFQMNYRAFDLFGLEVIGFAILTDDTRYHPKSFKYGRWSSQMNYKFKTFKLKNYQLEDFKNVENPFNAVMKTAWYGLKQNKLKTDEELFSLKFQLLRELLTQGFKRERITKIVDFIKYYMYFDKQAFYLKFDKKLAELENLETMTLQEVIKSEIIRIKSEESFEQGIEQGIEKGIDRGKYIGIVNMLAKGFEVEMISDLLEVSLEKVLEIKERFEKETEEKP